MAKKKVVKSKDPSISMRYRWSMKGQNLPELFLDDASFDYVNKLISFRCLDVWDDGFQALVWADKLRCRQLTDETLTFTTWDSSGKEMYRQVFSDLKLHAHTNFFKYSLSEGSYRAITVSYENVATTITPFEKPE